METYNGHVRTPADAIILFEACRLGLLPRVQRRLSEKERQSIKSGSVFVWDEREAGMRRWTDGKSWSASRVSGSFLTYREMEGKRGGNTFAPLAATRAGKTPDSTRGSDSDLEMAGDDGHDGYRYKPDGLMKQSFSITTSSGNHLHLISYYARSHPNAGGLTNPTHDPQLRHIRPQKGMYPESTVHEQQSIPAVTRSPMVSAPYSTVPHMAGYARTAPPQQPMQYMPPGYGWAPQPPMYSAQHYGWQYGPHGPPPPNGHSPLSYSQSAVPTSQPQQYQSPQSHPQHQNPHPVPYPTSQMAQHQSPRSSPYDRSPIPNDSLRHNQPPPHHPASGPGNGHPQQSWTSSPGVPGQTPLPYQQMKQHIEQGPPHPPSRPISSNPSTTPPLSKIDPRLMAPSPLVQHQPPGSHHSRSPSPLHSQQKQNEGPVQSNQAAVQSNGASQPSQPSQASQIPSIGSIMNGSSTDNADARSDRSGSRSPGGSKRVKGNEPASEKVAFNEDARALRVLDRAFKT